MTHRPRRAVFTATFIACAAVLLMPVAAIARALPAQPHSQGCQSRLPCLRLSPNHGAVGTVVHISGRITKDQDAWRANLSHPKDMSLVRTVRTSEGVCGLINSVADPTIAMDRSGRVRGYFTVTDQVTCAYGLIPPRSLAGDYRLAVGCATCQVALFHRDEPQQLPLTGFQRLGVALFGLAMLLMGTILLLVGRRTSEEVGAGAVSRGRGER